MYAPTVEGVHKYICTLHIPRGSCFTLEIPGYVCGSHSKRVGKPAQPFFMHSIHSGIAQHAHAQARTCECVHSRVVHTCKHEAREHDVCHWSQTVTYKLHVTKKYA